MVYGSRHCIHDNYSETTNFSSPVAGAADVNGIDFIGAWDASIGKSLPGVLPHRDQSTTMPTTIAARESAP